LEVSRGDAVRVSTRTMHGGHGHWAFYITEVDRIEQRHQSNLPEGSLSSAEAQAGFGVLVDVFGFSLTLVYLEEKTGLTEEEIMAWTVAKLHHRIELYAWQANAQKKYNDIQTKKMKKK